MSKTIPKTPTPTHEVGSTMRSVFKIGKSVAITLPQSFVKTHGIKRGDKVLISYDSFLMLDPKHRQKILNEMKKKKITLKTETGGNRQHGK